MLAVRLVRELGKDSPACLAALILLAAIPLLPEYIAPLLVFGSVFAAAVDARQRGTCLQIGTVGKLLLIYIVYVAVGVLFSAHKLNSLATFAMWLTMFGAYTSVVTVVFTRHRLQTLLLLCSLAAGAVGLIACVQYVLRDVCLLPLPNQVWQPIDEWFYRFFPMDVDMYIAVERAAATFNNPNIMAEFLVMALPFVALCGFDGQRTRLKLTARLCLLFALLGVAVSYSRGAYLAVLAMVLLIIVTNLRKITPLLLSLVAAAALVPEAILARLITIGSIDDFSITQRFDAWEVAVQAILENPLIGLGPGVSNFWEYAQSMGVNVPHAHNIILQVLLEGGFVALFLLTLVGIRMLQNSIDLLNHSPKTRLFGVFSLVFAVAFMVYGMVDYPFLCPKLVGTFTIILGTTDAVSALYIHQRTVPLMSWIAQPFRQRVKQPIEG